LIVNNTILMHPKHCLKAFNLLLCFCTEMSCLKVYLVIFEDLDKGLLEDSNVLFVHLLVLSLKLLAKHRLLEDVSIYFDCSS
jgi:hypothetical protein